MSRIFSSKKRFVLGVLASLAIATAAMAYWTTVGGGDGEAGVAEEATGEIQITGSITDLDFRPGHTSNITLTATNTDTETNLRVDKTTLSAINPDEVLPADDGLCLDTWFEFVDSTVTHNQTIAANAENVPLTGGPHKIKFNNDLENQDACKGATVDFEVDSE